MIGSHEVKEHACLVVVHRVICTRKAKVQRLPSACYSRDINFLEFTGVTLILQLQLDLALIIAGVVRHIHLHADVLIARTDQLSAGQCQERCPRPPLTPIDHFGNISRRPRRYTTRHQARHITAEVTTVP